MGADGWCGVDRGAHARVDLEVEVVHRRVASVPDIADDLALRDVTRRAGVRTEVRVVVAVAVVALEADRVAAQRVGLELGKPVTMATNGVPYGLIMSTPW